MEVKREPGEQSTLNLSLQGFNPCFDGSEARGESRARSIFRSKVSILVLMEVKRENTGHFVVGIGYSRFNPCFDGSEARDGLDRGVGERADLVSILVLMEVKREGGTPAPIRSAISWFQSLF